MTKSKTFYTWPDEEITNAEQALHASLPKHILELAAAVQEKLPSDEGERVHLILALISQYHVEERVAWTRALEIGFTVAALNSDVSVDVGENLQGERQFGQLVLAK